MKRAELESYYPELSVMETIVAEFVAEIVYKGSRLVLT